jgi:hypothetical protein
MLSHTLGIPVRYEPFGIPVFPDALRSEGYSPFLVQHLSSVPQDYRNAIFAGANYTNANLDAHRSADGGPPPGLCMRPG